MSFSFVQITDHHLSEAEDQLTHGFSTAHALRQVLRHIASTVGNKIDFLLSSGDLVQPTTDTAYANLRRILNLQTGPQAPGPLHIAAEGLDLPFYVLPGNHDDRDVFFRNLFPNSPCQSRLHYAFEHKGIQFVALDWGAQNRTVLEAGMLEFLESKLQTGRPSVILTHQHMVFTGTRWLDNFVTEDVDQVWEVLVRYPNVLGVFSGHAHTTYEQHVEGIPVFGLRSTAFPFAPTEHVLLTLQPPHYRLVTIQDGILTTRVFEVNL